MEPSVQTDSLAREVIGAAIEVHKHLGPGFIESVYEEALAFELTARNVRFERQQNISVVYKGQNIGNSRLDFLIEKQLIVELKAVDSLLPIHHAQVISYLKTSQLQLGLLLNFNMPILKHGIKRIINTK